MVEKVTKAKAKALKENDLKVYEKLEKEEMDKKQIEEYLLGDQKVDKDEINFDELNKDYGKDLDQKAYQDFWKDQPKKRPQSLKPLRAGSDQDAKLAALPTPERTRRQIRDQIFPEIQKNSVWKNRDIDFETLYEDPMFDFTRPQKKRRSKLSIAGSILDFGQPLLPKIPQSAMAASMPDLGGGE